jgi:hypothetical protein
LVPGYWLSALRNRNSAAEESKAADLPVEQSVRQGTVGKGVCKAGRRFLCATLSLAVVVCCVQRPDLTGKWQEVGKKSTIEFRADGTFRTVDDIGMAASGKYALQGNGRIRFEIVREGSSPEILEGRFTLRGGELTLSYTHPGETEIYGRLAR